MAINAPFGTWKSPIHASLLSEKTLVISDTHVDCVSKKIYHIEDRPWENGRAAIVQRDNVVGAQEKTVLPPQFNARTSVHEYGGGAFTVHAGIILFSDWNTKRLFSMTGSSCPEPLTPESRLYRYGDPCIHPSKTHLICIREDHSSPQVRNELVCVPISGKSESSETVVSVVATGHSFYAASRFNNAGDKLAWVSWNHPDMPWTGSELWVANWDGLTLMNPIKISGQKNFESVSQPRWAAGNNILYFLSDRTGYYQHYVVDFSQGSNVKPVLNSPLEYEFGGPDWRLNRSTYALLSDSTLFVTYLIDGVANLGIISATTSTLRALPNLFVTVADVRAIDAHTVVFTGSTRSEPQALIAATIDTDIPQYTVLKQTSTSLTSIDTRYISPCEARKFPSKDGRDCYMMYYHPKNPTFQCSTQKPPLLIRAHGGPTAQAGAGLSTVAQYWTSRGWAYADVNYAGSSGYGRSYRELLDGHWGIRDVEDVVAASTYLTNQGEVDGSRVCLDGASSGGFTVLRALVSEPTVFAAATSYFGISSLLRLAGDTHKFESKYLLRLIGSSFVDNKEVFDARSPLRHVNQVRTPHLLLQGRDDRVVPLNQAERWVQKVKEASVDVRVDLIVFDGEGHGFRQSENIRRAIVEEEEFYRQVLRLDCPLCYPPAPASPKLHS